MSLTKEADKTMCCLYKEYLNRVKQGQSKSSSKVFKRGYAESDDVLSQWYPEDVADAYSELKKTGFITYSVTGSITLTSDGISYMQNRFKNGVEDVVDFITKFIP